MEKGLISKKELLQKYGISYGALYRWKRMGLIPEEWFLKKATVTGQETFFPEALICERIELIRSREDATSLEELAKTISGKKQTEALLLLSTPYGEKNFLLRELRRIVLLSPEGKEIDCTSLLRQLLESPDDR